MFTHNFKYTLKTLIKNKALLFWTFAFPIILGFFFNLAFSEIESSEKLDIINLGVVENNFLNENAYYKEALNSLGELGENHIFDITYTDLEKVENMLEENEISGYVYFDQEPHIVIKSNGINETIIKTVFDEIEEYSILANEAAEEAYKNGKSMEEIQREAEKIIEEFKTATTGIVDKSNKNMSYTMIEYYTLIAMSCLYGGTISLVAILNILANISSRGKRVSTSCIKKNTLILSSLSAAYLVQLIGLSILFLFLICVIKVDFGSHLFEVLLLSIAGSLAGLSLGIFIGAVIKANENTKTGILIAFTMFGCFLSGMMGITMKYIVDSNIPILNKINPANMITDGFYALYHYGASQKFYFNLASIIIFSSILIIFSINILRRQKYDSI